MRVAVMIALVLLGSPVLPSFAKTAKLNIGVMVDQDGLQGRPDAVGGAWMGYAMARANWLGDHVKDKSIDPRSYVSSFDEELYGRDNLATIWSELKEKDKKLGDPYLDQLEKVKAAGFLREYVWANLGADGWVEPTGLKAAEYNEWAKANLAGHVVETHGGARINGAP